MQVTHQGMELAYERLRSTGILAMPAWISRVAPCLGGLSMLLAGWPGFAAAQCGVEELLELQSDSGQSDDNFGGRLAISGRFLAVVDSLDGFGTPQHGSVSIFERDHLGGEGWRLADKLFIDGLAPGLLTNCDLEIDDDLLLLGIQEDDTLGIGAGAVYVFERTEGGAGSWNQVAKLLPHDSHHGDWFGSAVSRSGDFIAVGAANAYHAGVDVGGAVYIFQRSPTEASEWREVQKLIPAELGPGSFFGIELALEGDRLVVGAPFHDAVAVNSGAAFVFHRDAQAWELQEVLAPEVLKVEDNLGFGLALRGDVLVVGAPGDDQVAKDVGALYPFEWTGTRWSGSPKLTPLGLPAHSSLGASVSIDSDRIYAGAPLAGVGGAGSGAVLEFDRGPKGSSWYQSAVIQSGDIAPNDLFGILDAAGGVLAVGAGKSFKPGSVYLFSSRDRRTTGTYCSGSGGSVPDCIPALATFGVPTASLNSTFRIWSREVPGGHFGLFLYTTDAAALYHAALGGVCLPGGSVRRSGILWSGGTAGACDGVLDIDWSSFGAALAQTDLALTTPGTTVHGQFVWFEPLGPTALTWSDAVAFQLCP